MDEYREFATNNGEYVDPETGAKVTVQFFIGGKYHRKGGNEKIISSRKKDMCIRFSFLLSFSFLSIFRCDYASL